MFAGWALLSACEMNGLSEYQEETWKYSPLGCVDEAIGRYRWGPRSVHLLAFKRLLIYQLVVILALPFRTSLHLL